jgi:hypothetical protein
MTTEIDNLISQMATAPLVATTAKPTANLQDLLLMAKRVADVDAQINALEKQLEDLKATRQSLTWSTMPALQQELDCPDITVKGTRIRLETLVKASSAQKDWDKAFALLSKHGETEVVKWTASLTLPKLSTEEQQKLLAKLEKAAGIPVSLRGSVDNRNLKKWLVDLEGSGKLTDELRAEFKYEKAVITVIEEGEVKDVFSKTPIDGI